MSVNTNCGCSDPCIPITCVSYVEDSCADRNLIVSNTIHPTGYDNVAIITPDVNQISAYKEHLEFVNSPEPLSGIKGHSVLRLTAEFIANIGNIFRGRNVGVGAKIYKGTTTVGTDTFQDFKTIKTSESITVTEDTDEIITSVNTIWLQEQFETIPDASPTERGFTNTIAQTFAGTKSFNDMIWAKATPTNTVDTKLGAIGMGTDGENPLFSFRIDAAGNLTLDKVYNSVFSNVLSVNRENGDVSIGTINQTAQLEVFGKIKSSKEFIITDTTNNLSTRFGALALNNQSLNILYNSAFGYSALYNLTTGVGNTAIGNNTLDSIIASNYNTAVGYQSLRRAGNHNVSLGANNVNTLYSADYGVFLGSNVANHLTTGRMNIGIGSSALGGITTGEKNIAIGFSTGATNVSGSSNNMNVMIGYYITGVVGEYNNLIGGYTGQRVVGNGNLINGFGAGSNGINGSNNIILGRQSGQLIRSGENLTSINNSVFIGDNTRAATNGQTNQIVIGSIAIGNGSNTATIGNSSVTALYVGGNGAGVVLKTPDGLNSYKISIDNSGAVISTLI